MMLKGRINSICRMFFRAAKRLSLGFEIAWVKRKECYNLGCDFVGCKKCKAQSETVKKLFGEKY